MHLRATTLAIVLFGTTVSLGSSAALAGGGKKTAVHAKPRAGHQRPVKTAKAPARAPILTAPPIALLAPEAPPAAVLVLTAPAPTKPASPMPTSALLHVKPIRVGYDGNGHGLAWRGSF